jgi:hypothetical protein
VGVHNSSRTFKYVHSDLWGPVSVSTHGRDSYFLIILLMIIQEGYGCMLFRIKVHI